MTPDALKQALYAAAHQPAESPELGRAAAAWFDGAPHEDGWADFVDFFALEWVDRDGLTLVERVLADGLTPLARRWLLGVRTGVFVIDEVDGPLAFCRDAATDEELCLVTGETLVPRAVLQGRVLPDDQGRLHLSGEPDVYEPMRVMARMSLTHAWLDSPRRALVERLAALRAGFLRQREQRTAFVAFFGGDQLLFPTAQALEQHLNGFMDHLLFRYQPVGLGGQTYAQEHQARTGEPAVQVKVELSESLGQAGAIGVIYDAREGIHFLPAFDAFVAHLQGHQDHPELVRSYLQDDGITALPFLRVGGTERLAALLACDDAPMLDLLAPFKGPAAWPSPSVLPHFDG